MTLHLYRVNRKTGRRALKPVCGTPAILPPTAPSALAYTGPGYKPEENDDMPALERCPGCVRWNRRR